MNALETIDVKIKKSELNICLKTWYIIYKSSRLFIFYDVLFIYSVEYFVSWIPFYDLAKFIIYIAVIFFPGQPVFIMLQLGTKFSV